jgi:regulator of sigma E protease
MGILEGVLNDVINIVLLLVILVGLVVIHELGHFISARRAGVRVHEFGIGFPPRARVLARDSETIYTLNWLPIGGFVRLEGEEGESADARAFVNQGLRTRLVILLAGVVMNFVLAFLVFTAIAAIADPTETLRFGVVQPGSPAESIGLVASRVTPEQTLDTSGDEIMAIDGRTFALFDDFPERIAPINYLRSHGGQTVVLSVKRASGQVEDIPVQLRVPGPEHGALGIEQVVIANGPGIQQDPVSAVRAGLDRTLEASTLILEGVRDLVTDLANPQVSGPVGIVQAIGVVRAELPPVFLVWFIGVLSANLAVINALPFPPMDGGRVAMSLVQAVSGNRITPALERAVYLAGFLLLMALLAWITYFDLQRTSGI